MAHSGKSVLVTGGCGGLGKAIVDSFMAQGANVVVVDYNEDLVSKFKSEVAPADADRVLVLTKDVTSEEALDSIFQEAADKFGALDYVVNNAGIMDRVDPAGELDKAIWDRVIAVNLTAPTMITKRAVNQMMAKQVKGAAIVNISSIAGFKGFCAGTAYTASKHGLLGLTKSTATFYQSKGIRCNALCLGGMKTNIQTAFANGINEAGLGVMYSTCPPIQHASNSCDITKVAKLVMYLCSEDAEPVNGACWTMDGGVTAN